MDTNGWYKPSRLGGLLLVLPYYMVYIYRNVLNLLNLYTGWWIQHFKTQDKQLDNHWLVTSEQYPISRLPYRTYLPGHCHGLETTHPRLRKVAAKLNKLDTIEQRTVNRPDADIWVPTLFCVYICVFIYVYTVYIYSFPLSVFFPTTISESRCRWKHKQSAPSAMVSAIWNWLDASPSGRHRT
jgi:hypothetical protein